MPDELSPNTKAILLLTAPLAVGRGETRAAVLAPAEYKKLARHLVERRMEPRALLELDGACLEASSEIVPRERLEGLLGRGFQLAQAVEHWASRAIWVISRADPEYPKRLKARMQENAPAVLYGCGRRERIEGGGLAVVGSRDADGETLAWTREVGSLCARARRRIVSGGARGVDQAAMHGAIEASGCAVGILADSLERAALARANRDALREGRLLLLSAYDPAARFHVGNAMNRNKLIYAMADAGLVVHAAVGKGGTWAGATEQLERLAYVPVFVRAPKPGTADTALQTLMRKGARAWPAARTPELIATLLDEIAAENRQPPYQGTLFSGLQEPRTCYPNSGSSRDSSPQEPEAVRPITPSGELLAFIRDLVVRLGTEHTTSGIATMLEISKGQAKQWLERLVEEGALEKLQRPVRYRVTSRAASSGEDDAHQSTRES
ncbi:MAG: DNA-protecting protein DprA [Planctomycetes bacterium]|nr:DNA-protecting protein DprA [Planctomycetota bacterium]